MPNVIHQRICVCGHIEVVHYESGRCGEMSNTSQGDFCACGEFRPVLDWPDSEGWWWIEFCKASSFFGSSSGIIHSRWRDGEYILNMGTVSMGRTFTKQYSGSITCVRLLEQNPFGGK